MLNSHDTCKQFLNIELLFFLAESYFVMFAQFIRNDPHLIRESGIPLEPILEIGTFLLRYTI
jgi:hypothetical protein